LEDQVGGVVVSLQGLSPSRELPCFQEFSLEGLEKKDLEQDDKIQLIMEYIRNLNKVRQDEEGFKNRPRIGYK